MRHGVISAFLGLIVVVVYVTTGSLAAAIVTHGLATVIRILYVEFI